MGAVVGFDFFFLPLYFGFIFAFLVCGGLLLLGCVCVCVCVRESCCYFWHFRWLGGGVAAAYSPLLLPPSTPPPGPVLGDGGIRSGAGEGQRSAGSGFEGDSVRLSAGEE